MSHKLLWFWKSWAFYMFMCFLPPPTYTHIQSYQYKYWLTDQLFESLSLAMHSKLYFVSFKFWELGIVVYLQLWLTTIPPIDRQICLNLESALFCFDRHNSPEVMLCWFGPQVWQLLFHSRKPISTLQRNSQQTTKWRGRPREEGGLHSGEAFPEHCSHIPWARLTRNRSLSWAQETLRFMKK